MTNKYQIVTDDCPDHIEQAIGEILESKKILFTKPYGNVFIFTNAKYWLRASRIFLRYNKELPNFEMRKEKDER